MNNKIVKKCIINNINYKIFKNNIQNTIQLSSSLPQQIAT